MPKCAVKVCKNYKGRLKTIQKVTFHRKSHPSNAVPRGCNCSLSDLMTAESVSEETANLDDTEVYFVPAEIDLFQKYFTPQPFLISNPVKFNPRIKKGSGTEEEYSEESSERIETYERKTLIRISNDDESQPPSYLDLEIQDVASSNISVIKQGSFIPTFESAEQALVECLDLHILDFTRKYGSVENFNEFWAVRNLQTYEDLSNSDLNDKIKKYCSETEFLIEQSLQDIKRGVPKRKTNFRNAHEDEDDLSIKHRTKESAESERYSLENINSKYENSLESSSSLDDTGLTVDNINESKSFDTFFYKTTASPKNTAKVYDTRFDMDTMASEDIFETTKEINKSDVAFIKNKSILDETEIFPISTTPLSDVLFFWDTNDITEKPSDEIEEHAGQEEKNHFDTMPFENVINKFNNEMITNEPISTTIFPASTTTRSEEQSLGDINVNIESRSADTEERTNESLEFDFDKMPSNGNLKQNHENIKFKINTTSDEPFLSNTTFFPASSTPRQEELSLGNKSSNPESSMAEKQKGRESVFNRTIPDVNIQSNNVINKDTSSNSETFTPKNHGSGKYESKEYDLDTIPSEIILNPSDENFRLNIAGIMPILDSKTFFPSSTTPRNEKLPLGDISNLETSTAGQEAQGKDRRQVLDLNAIPSKTFLKASNDTVKHYAKVAKEPKIEESTYFSTVSTTLQNDKLSLGDMSRNSATSMTAKPKGRDNSKEFDLDTMATEVNIKSNNEINISEADTASDKPILGSITFFSVSTTPQNGKLSFGDISSNSEPPMAEKEVDDDTGTKLDYATTPSEIILKPSNDIFKHHLNDVSAGPILDEVIYFPTVSTSPQNEKVTMENAKSSAEQAMIGVQEKPLDGDINLDSNTMASNVILNIDGSEIILNETSKLITTSNSPLNDKPFINLHTDTISDTSSAEDTTSVAYISTTPVTAVQTQRPKFKESEVQIPKIITKECLNNEVESFITDNEALPNNDFDHSDATAKSSQNKLKPDSRDDYSELNPNSSKEVIDTTKVINKNFISGNLYFGSSQDLVPVRLVQTDNDKVSLGIDGHSLCKKLLQKPNSTSLLLSTLCDFACKMQKNNSTCVSQ